MTTTRPFSYNNDSLIPGTEQYGDLVLGYPTNGFESTGLVWWNGPDEDLGYVIAYTSVNMSGDPQQPTNVPNTFPNTLGNVQFWRTEIKTNELFVTLANYVTGQTFTTPVQAKDWLLGNGYWTSWGSDWILNTGFWNDYGIWDDTDVWID